jgi:predicted PurR-regulated permease PerM
MKGIVRVWHIILIFLFAFSVSAVLFNFGSSPIRLAQIYGAKIGQAMGLSMTVTENPYNKLALQLDEKEQSLTERENNLNLLQQQLLQSNENYKIILMILTLLVFVLLFLVILNFYLDGRRKRQEELAVLKKIREERGF